MFRVITVILPESAAEAVVASVDVDGARLASEQAVANARARRRRERGRSGMGKAPIGPL
jgi:hypothetical protein